jgi:hypothetical protein
MFDADHLQKITGIMFLQPCIFFFLSCTILQVSTHEGKSLDIYKVKLGPANLPNFQKQEGTIET